MREQIKLLENHANTFADLFDRFGIIVEHGAMNLNGAVLMFFKTVQAPDELWLALAWGAANNNSFSLIDWKIDIF